MPTGPADVMRKEPSTYWPFKGIAHSHTGGESVSGSIVNEDVIVELVVTRDNLSFTLIRFGPAEASDAHGPAAMPTFDRVRGMEAAVSHAYYTNQLSHSHRGWWGFRRSRCGLSTPGLRQTTYK